jgi:AsmA protein
VRWLLRTALALALLVAVVLGALAVALPRIAGSAAVRARIEAAARDALGRELRFETLEAGLFPPALRVMAPRIAGATEQAPPLLEAKSVSLELALLPLLSRTVAVDSLVVDGATVHLTRTKNGIELPTPPQGDAKPRDDADSEPKRADDGGSDVALALRGVSLRDSTLVLVDRAVAPAVTWELRDLRADARGHLLGSQVDLEASAALASGGRLRLDGSAALTGEREVDLDLELEKLALAPLAPYVEGTQRLAGTASGTAHVVGVASDPQSASGVLDFDGLELQRGDLRAAGRLRVETELASPLRGPSGTFRADAEAAELAFGKSFHKPAGVTAEVSGRVAQAKGGGVAIEDLAIRLRDIELRGRVAKLSPLQLELRSESIDLKGSEALFPGLAALAPSGQARIESLAYSAQPQSLRGRVLLDGVEAHPEGRPPLALRGALVAEGQSVRLADGRLAAGGQDVGLDAALEDLFGAPRYRMALDAKGADANEVVTALAGKRDTLFGLLGMQASFAGPLQGDLLQHLQGRAGFGVDDGRLAGVSLLRAVFDRLGSAGDVALGLGKAFGGRDLQRFYGDEFETLRGTFDVKDGLARTDDLTFVYRGYQVLLQGTVGLADLALDTEGELTFHEDVDALIAEELGIRNYTPKSRSITLAAVKGTLADPKVRVSSKSVADLASTYAAPLYVDPLRKKAEKALGKDGAQVVDQGIQILDGLLGGRKNRDREEEPEADAQDQPAPSEQAPAEEEPTSPNP